MAMVMNHHEELMRGMRVALWLTMLTIILLILIAHLVL
jgi:cbb3-type cytochrome oxidase subunit 3